MTALFYLGTHMVSPRWWEARVPLFVSVRRLRDHKSGQLRARLPQPYVRWALDSGGFTEVSKNGRWLTDEDTYVEEVRRVKQEMPHLEWVAPQDWMCEPAVIRGDPGRGWPGTHLSVSEHQRRTVASFVALRERLGELVIPVVQGYEPAEYDRCIGMYQDAGVDLAAERIVGLGSVCRRSRTREIVKLVRYIGDHGLAMHGFGLKGDSFRSLGELLTSADSMAWSMRGRKVEGCTSSHKTEANCLRFALERRALLLGQPEEEAA